MKMIMKSINMSYFGIGILLNGWGYLLFSGKAGKNTFCIFSNFPKITYIKINQPEVEENIVW